MKKIAVVAACLVALSVHAQKKQPWPAEPTAVFGIPIGERFENDRIEECGGVKAETEKNPVAACALIRPGFGGITISGFPIPSFEEGFIGREDGIVTAIMLHGQQAHYGGIKGVLVERYGKPHKTTTEKVQNKMGAVFTSEVLYWEGKKVALTLYERSGKVDRTSALFTSLEQSAKRSGDHEKTLKESASKL